jgi:hypothetical protein
MRQMLQGKKSPVYQSHKNIVFCDKKTCQLEAQDRASGGGKTHLNKKKSSPS